MLELVHGEGDGRRNDIAENVEGGAGAVVTEENLELIGGLLGGSDGVGLVGLELGELEVEALEVELGDVAGFVALAADVEFALVVG